MGYSFKRSNKAFTNSYLLIICVYSYLLVEICVYTDTLVDKYINTYHSTIKMKTADVKLNTYINSSEEINDEDPKFKIGNIVRIWKYKKIFMKI